MIRDGLPQKIPTTDVTVGDLVKLASGGRVPADVRVLASDGLKVDNSSFTGTALLLCGVGGVQRGWRVQTLDVCILTTHFCCYNHGTGESLPVELSTEATDAAHALHSHNMAFSSALVVEGACAVSVWLPTHEHQRRTQNPNTITYTHAQARAWAWWCAWGTRR